jgi:kynureninase
VTDLASHYARFRVGERVLLTGHSHQAWPDVAFDAQQRAWLEAAELVDDKWERAAVVADEVRAGFRALLSEPGGEIALGQNTHELVVRLLSAVLTVPGRTALITTTGEFHTIRRQVDRLAETVEVIKVAAHPAETLAERLAAVVNERTACVLVSSVLFETAEIVPNLSLVARACAHHGATLLVDVYHHLNVIPFDIRASGLEQAFITGGGYKYCQLGEGNCFLRVPPDCDLRPVITGWFAEFADLDRRLPAGSSVSFGAGAARFAGSTYDPTSHYRAAAVFAFHREQQLAPSRLRDINRRQVRLLHDLFDAADINPAIARVEAMPDERRGGFLAIRTRRAAALVTALRAAHVWSDARGEILRLGPAPYLSDEQLRAGMQALREALGSIQPKG